MKKYTLLGHMFKLEPRAYEFIVSYIQRIDEYALTHHISSDIVDDIKYSIIEKLYSASAPISESYVITIANTIGEPEIIFEKSESDPNDLESKNILDRWLGKKKPMIWGVAYWISKSLNLPVSIIRLILIGSIFLYGTSLWIYPLLALFVPFQDKKSTTGKTGNIFFELIRILIWSGLICLLGGLLLVFMIGGGIVAFFPMISYQSLQTLVPSYIVSLAILSLISLTTLLVGSIGALFKKSRVSKTMAMIASVILFASGIITLFSGISIASQYNNNPPTRDTQILATGTIAQDFITINLTNMGHTKQGNYFPTFFYYFPSFFNDFPFLSSQEINLLPSTDNQVIVEVVDSMNIPQVSNRDNILEERTSVVTTLSGNILDIAIPSTMFRQKVPFSFAKRAINISLPIDKKIIYNNSSELRFSTPHSWIEQSEGSERMIYCEDTLSFIYNDASKSWRCANTSSSEVNTNEYSDIYTNDGTDMYTGPDQSDEGAIEEMLLGLSLEKAKDIATTHNRLLRVVEQDGEELPRTEDYRPGRINVEIRNGSIIDLDIE